MISVRGEDEDRARNTEYGEPPHLPTPLHSTPQPQPRVCVYVCVFVRLTCGCGLAEKILWCVAHERMEGGGSGGDCGGSGK